MSRRLPGRKRLCLVGLVSILGLSPFPVFAQNEAGIGEHSWKGQRGNTHSSGWLERMKLKGGPVTPRFPRLGEGIERHELENGLVVYLAPDPRLPLVRLDLLFSGGSDSELEGQRGVVGLTGSQMRSGGTESMAPDDLDDRLSFLATTISTNFGRETGRASLDVLKKDFAEGLRLFADVILRPRFDEDRFRLSKRNRSFRRRYQNDDPGRILSRELNALLYGESHPRGRRPFPPSMQEIERADLVAIHQHFVRPNRAFLSAVGDFEPAAMLAELRGAFGSWERGEDPPKTETEFDPKPKPGVYLVDRSVNQSSISLAHFGLTRDHPDRYAVTLMNTVLGGGSFSSRITERVRSDEGLAYSASSRFETNGREIGLFQATVQTKTETTAEAIASILDEIRSIRTGGTISQNEFETARESFLFSYVFRFQDLRRNVLRLMEYEREGRPLDTDRRDFEGYCAVRPADLERVSKKHLRPEDLTIFVVGNAKAIESQLEPFGAVHRIELKERRGEPGTGSRRRRRDPGN